jgi:hypothetical protein
MGCEERHEPRERLPALLALLPSLLLPLGVCNREGRGRWPWIWAGAALGRTPRRGQGRGGAHGKNDRESELL